MKDIKTNNRRKRSLERNRVAASKCRKRKNKWINNLEEMKVGLEALHSVLQSEHMDLLQESCQLKNYLICHATCHNPNIDEWINNEALKYVRKLSDLPQVSCLESPSPMGKLSIPLHETRNKFHARSLNGTLFC